VAIRVVRLGTARAPSEGPRLGTVRSPPRGVRKADYARRNFYDAWLPDLAPSAALVRWISAAPISEARWRTFAKRYRTEMKRPEAQRLLEVLALLSRAANFSVGCYCEDEARCHRSVLGQLLAEHGAAVLK
jgi:uncharacterized protein YeaO (DUF488 family)